jgi:hypothetical protein
MPPDLELNAQIAAERAAALTSALRPWRQKIPTVDVVEDSRPGKAANHLVDAAGEASIRQRMADVRTRHHAWIREHGTDLPEVADWTWTG